MKFTDTKSTMLYLKQVQIANEIQNKEIALKLNITESGVSGLFKQKNITLNKLSELCNIIGCDLDITFINKK